MITVRPLPLFDEKRETAKKGPRRRVGGAMVHREIRGKENSSWEEPFPASRGNRWILSPHALDPITPNTNQHKGMR